MYEGNKQKFLQNEDMKKKLIQTKGNITFGNGFWPEWNGWILERVRAELRNNGEEDDKKIQEIEERMVKYEKSQKWSDSRIVFIWFKDFYLKITMNNWKVI